LTPIWAQALVLGLIQGLTEFLPISSSAHLILLPELTGWPHLGRHFDVALHLGTLVAICAYFQDDVRRLFVGLSHLLERRQSSESRLTLQLILASLPPALLGLCLGDWLEKHFNNLVSIAVCLGVFGLILGWVDRRALLRREIQDVSYTGALTLGLAQAVALIPGVSRCGATLTAALWLGLTRREAARLSFLSALPVTAGACLLKALRLGRALPDDLLVPSLLGIAMAAVSGWLCIGLLVRYLRNHSLQPFVVYRVALALALLGKG